MIIVLTPVKNEEWILYQFLSITSLFADCIIIADQNSTDESRNICKQFSKVHLIENNNEEYDEAGRQDLLIDTARSLFPDDKRILLALDADEIISSDSLEFNNSWTRIKSSPPGTTIYFEKPDVLPGVKNCIRYKESYFPIGYVDDDFKHSPKFIHSKRVPENQGGAQLLIDDIKILHFALARKNMQLAKLRYYTCIENLKKTTPIYLRREVYRSSYKVRKFNFLKDASPLNANWLKEWDNKKLDLRNLYDTEFSWHDFEVLKLFKRVGYKRFFFEDIWKFDWEACRQRALQLGKEAPLTRIKKPGFTVNILSKLLDTVYGFYRWINQ